MDIPEYYSDLLIQQYRDKPRAAATIRALVEINNLYDLIEQIKYGINLNADSSAQKIIGLILGNNALDGEKVIRDVFGYKLYSQPSTIFSGYITYDSPVADDSFYTYSSAGDDYIPSQEELKITNKFTIFRNNGNTTLKEIDEFLLNYLPEVYVDETANMTLTYYVPGSMQDLFDILYKKNLLPKSSGVQILFSYT
ncbi:MAG: DUF2612 domain-containing protein [Candidatus Margulisbacteria bacterium]|jgi:hypothetical protein|nr:DUF2612 domain-containing protein [Candidatus Margulisiibacteriota bacterium]